MPKRSMKQDDPLEDFKRREIMLDGVTKVVHVAGAGPAVIVMAEMPGISPHVARFARWVRDAGFTVYMPSLFGRDGAVPGADEGTAVFQRACVSAEFRALGCDRWRDLRMTSAAVPASVPSGCASREISR
jgi:dienelactone hydrolase